MSIPEEAASNTPFELIKIGNLFGCKWIKHLLAPEHKEIDFTNVEKGQ